MALMTELIKYEPSIFGEAAQHDVWQEAMVEEYDSLHYEKPGMGGCAEATREKGGGIHMDLQGEACSIWKCRELIGVLRGKWVFTEGVY